jgi:hypothetical protein
LHLFLILFQVQDCIPDPFTCKVGNYINSSLCLPCPSGKFSTFWNATNCTDCPKGRYSSTAGSTTCAPCPLHTYGNTTGASNCNDCPLAFYTESSGSTDPSQCLLQDCTGTFAFPVSSDKGYSFQVNDGYTWYSARAACNQLAKGGKLAMVSNIDILDSIRTLPNFIGAVDVWVDGHRLVNDSQLYFDDGNLVPVNDSSIFATKQPDNAAGVQHCLKISKSQPSLDDFSCMSLFNFHVCEVSSKFCGQVCDPGYFFDISSSLCLECPSGQFSGFSGLTVCSSCSPGSFSSGSASSSCINCPIATFGNQTASTFCDSCTSNAITFQESSLEESQCVCSVGFFGKAYLGQECTPCFEKSEFCDYNVSEPFVNPGYWVSDKAKREYYACIPSDACLFSGTAESTTCADGYTGIRCGQCVALKYYRSNDACKQCGSEALKWIVFVAVIIILIYALLRITSFDTTLIPYDVRVAYSWMQVITLFPTLFDSWPRLILIALQVFAFINIDLNFVSPECSIAVSYWTMYFAKLSMPVILILVTYIAGIALEFFIKTCKIAKMKKRMTAEQLSAWIVRTPIIIMSMAYTYVMVQVAKPFGCRENNGKYVMYDRPDLECYDAQWFQNIPYVVLFIVFYLVFLPGVLIIVFVKFRDRTQSDWFMSRFGVITSFYKPSVYYWEFVVIFKKFLFSVTTTIISSHVGRMTKYFIIVSILFGFLMVEIVSLPFASDLSNQTNML